MNTYQAGDGRWITVMALEYDRYWKPFAETVMMRPDLADDARFNNQIAGFQNAEELAAIIDKEFQKYTGDEILNRLKAADIAHEINLRWKEIKNDVQALENGFIMECKMPSGRTDWVMGNPVRFNGEKTEIRRHAPRLGEHNDEILSDLGYSAEQIAAWRTGMIIK
jgi:crotonobetainyl-CoA:carnitine CoA-transferase CaiB-like acyl-CoA transferase